MIKDLKGVKINSVNPLCMILSKVNGYFEEINKMKYLTLVPTNKEMIKNEDLWCEIGDLIRLTTKNSEDYDEKYMKINSNDELPLNKTIEIHNATIVVTAVFNGNKKYYLQVLLVEYLYEL